MKYFKNKKYTIVAGLMNMSFVFVFGFALIGSLYLTQTMEAANKITVTTSINNPLGEKLTDIPSFIKKAIEIVLTVGVPVLVLAIIYTGFLFVQAQGNSTKLKDAKNALTNTLIGGALLLGAFVIAEAIGTTVEEIKSNV
jgi:hypothetical protein